MAIGANWKEIWGSVWKPVWVQSFATVPDVVGETQAQGTADIEAQGLTVAVTTAYSSVIAAGLIISQVPAAGAQVSPGSSVTITVSLGEAPPEDDGHYLEYARQRKRREAGRKIAEQVSEAELATVLLAMMMEID